MSCPDPTFCGSPETEGACRLANQETPAAALGKSARLAVAATILPLLAISTGCGGGGGGGGGGGATSGGSPSLPFPSFPTPATIIAVGQSGDGFGPVPFPGVLDIPARDPCDEVTTQPFGRSFDICTIMEDSAQNFQALGISSYPVARITVDVTKLLSGGTEYFAKPATVDATIAVLDEGFNPRQPSLEGVLLPQYSFLASSTSTIKISEVESYRLMSEANSITVRHSPSYYPLITIGLAKADADALVEAFNENFVHMFHGTGVSAAAAGKRVSITIASGTYRGQVIESTPGIAPGAKILPINVLGAISINFCTQELSGRCTKSRPYFITDSNPSPRLSAAIKLAKENNAFVSTFSLGFGGVPGHELTVANTGSLLITLGRERGNPALPEEIVTTFAAGELRITDALRVFSPFALPADHPDRTPATWPQATKDAITQGDGMALVFALGNDETNDHNGAFYKRTGIEEMPITMTVMGTVHIGYYGGGVENAVLFTIANDLTQPFNGQDVREYGLDATITIEGKQYVTRTLSHYLNYLWKFPGNEDLKPYLLAVAGSRNIVVAGELQSVVIDPVSAGCGVAWERCITAPGSHSIPFPDPFDPAKKSFGYSFDTSYASSFVAGALALLKKHFPDLRADAAIDILLTTADDLGEPGPDPVYGMGHLNLARAMNPVGGMTTSRNGGGRQLANSRLLASAPLAALALAQGEITGYDDFSRPFHVHLADLVARQPVRRQDLAQLGVSRRQRQKHVYSRQILHHSSGTLEQVSFNLPQGWTFSHDFCASECLDEWGFMPANLDLGGLTRVGRKILADGSLALEASAGHGFANAASFRQFAARAFRRPAKGLAVSFEAGLADEKDTLLGSEFGGAFALQQGATTRFAQVSAQVSLAQSTEGYGSYTRAWTRAASFPDGLVTGISGLRANSARIGLRHGNMLRKGDVLELEWNMPLALTAGRISLRTGGYDAGGAPIAGTTAIDLRLARRQQNWGLSYVLPLAMLGMRGWLGAGVELRTDVPGIASDQQVYSLSASLQL